MAARVSGARLGAILGDERDSSPAYLWLADGIRAAVADGRVLHGTRLPSERELAPALGVSRTTVTRAYGVLAERGYASARHGSGTTVTLPGGPAQGGREPLADKPIEPGMMDLTQAAPVAAPGLQAAFERALDALPSFTSGRGYFPHGIPVLREAIAQRYRDRGVPTSADQIVVTTGASAAVGPVLTALTPTRGKVALESPGYPNTVAAVRGTGRRPVAVPAGVTGPDVEAFDNVLAGVGAALVVLDYQNPTGALASDEDRQRLAAVWRRRNTVGVVDECHCETWLDQLPTVLPMAAHHPAAITIGSASKTYWGGLRLGWIRAPRELVQAVAAARRSFDLGSAVMEQLALAELMTAQPGLHDDTRQEMRRTRDLLLEFGTELGWQCRPPSGGLSIWWRLPAPRSNQLVAAAAQEGLALLSGSAFAVDGRGLESFIRTPYTLRTQEVQQVLPVLRRAAQMTGLA